MRRYRRFGGVAAKCPRRSGSTPVRASKRIATNQFVDSTSKRRCPRRSRRARALPFPWRDSRPYSLIGKIHVKLLLYSHAFSPSVGGVETIVSTLARGLAKSNEVTVVTQTAAENFDTTSSAHRIVRQPSFLTL